jgi:hypothetical protein
MQIKEQWKGSKNWKLITGVATAATLGLGAIAVAAPGANDVPETINLNDRAVVTRDSFVTNDGSFVPFDISFDSPDGSPSMDSLSLSNDTTQDSPDDSISAQELSADSTDDSFDSPDMSDSFDSPDSSDLFDSPHDSD